MSFSQDYNFMVAANFGNRAAWAEKMDCRNVALREFVSGKLTCFFAAATKPPSYEECLVKTLKARSSSHWNSLQHITDDDGDRIVAQYIPQLFHNRENNNPSIMASNLFIGEKIRLETYLHGHAETRSRPYIVSLINYRDAVQPHRDIEEREITRRRIDLDVRGQNISIIYLNANSDAPTSMRERTYGMTAEKGLKLSSPQIINTADELLSFINDSAEVRRAEKKLGVDFI